MISAFELSERELGVIPRRAIGLPSEVGLQTCQKGLSISETNLDHLVILVEHSGRLVPKDAAQASQCDVAIATVPINS